jgi:hypothetical protein
MPNISVDLPRLHVAGSDAHYDAHIEVGQHGFALFLAPDADHPMLDIDGTPQQLRDLVSLLQAAFGVSIMRHTLYEDPLTHKFAVVRLSSRHNEGDTVPIPATARWFGTREEAAATLSDLFEQDKDDHIDDRVH